MVTQEVKEMKELRFTRLLAGVIAGILFLAACSTVLPQEEPISGIDLPVMVGDMALRVVEARVEDSYSNFYMMIHAGPDDIFYEVVLTIEGAGSRDANLAWGQENMELVSDGFAGRLERARPVLVGDEIEYHAGEDFQYQYAYIYVIPRHSPYKEFRLNITSGGDITLDKIVEIPVVSTVSLVTPQGNTVNGGSQNEASGSFATVSGGSRNSASAFHTTVGGGHLNTASASHAFTGGGRENSSSNFYATIGGGYANTASGRDTSIGGGSRNSASGPRAAIGGGIRNAASGADSTIAGGAYNQAGDEYASIGGGTRNSASGTSATISGGSGNIAGGDHTTVGGGLSNQSAGIYASVGGGYGNSALGAYATVPGGSQNTAAGDYSLAAGYRAMVSPNHPGAMLLSDSFNTDFQSSAADEFAVRATGGVRFVTAVDEDGGAIAGSLLPPGSGSWTTLSDREMKDNLSKVNDIEILEALVALPLAEWNYISQDSAIRHIGPMAQDFQATFGLGEDPRYISIVDANGVALASIQGLYQLVQEKDSTIASQQQQITDLETRLTVLESSIRDQQRATTIFLLIIASTALGAGSRLLQWLKEIT
jgi:hypothetical protein